MQDEQHRLWSRVRAYLRLLLADGTEADLILGAFLEHLLESDARDPDLLDALARLHRWLPDRLWRSPPDRALSESQRLLGWFLSGFTFRERALIILSHLPGVGPDEARMILGVADDEASAILHDAECRMADVSVIILSPQAFVALDVATIVEDLGIRRIRVTPSLTGLGAMAAAERPLAVVADTEGAVAPENVRSMLARPLGSRIPAVILDSRGRPSRGDILLRKPFTARALRQALLAAIGA